jgi:hypothetical protein
MEAWPMKLTLVQPPRRQPDTDAVVYQDFNPVGPAVGKEVSTVRLRRTEHRDHSGKRSLSAGAPVNGLGGEPDGIDANHWGKPCMKHAQPSGSEAGHFTVMDLSPRGSEMITISSDARLGTVFTGTKAGKVAGD